MSHLNDTDERPFPKDWVQAMHKPTGDYHRVWHVTEQIMLDDGTCSIPGDYLVKFSYGYELIPKEAFRSNWKIVNEP